MAPGGRLNVILMTTDLRTGDAPGFHRIVFRVEAGGRSVGQVTVQISQDAYRKLRGQMNRMSSVRPEPAGLLKGWARWELMQRLDSRVPVQPLITITSSDIDDFGSYAGELRRMMRAS